VRLSNLAPRILYAWVVLAVIQIIAGMLIPLKAPQGGNVFAWLLLTNLLVIAVLAFASVRSGWHGWRLGAALFVIPFGIALLNMIEGAVFLTHSGLDWTMLLVYTLVVYAVAAPAWALILRGKSEAPFPVVSTPPLGWFWRFAVADVTYLILYFSAGLIIFPLVRDFYATQTLPSAGKIISLQLLLRGPVFTGICLLLMRMLNLRGVPGALALGAAFTVLSGVAPLLIPNPVFPDSVRWAHFCEVTSSNFIFGAVVAWLWNRPRVAAQPVIARAA